MKIAYFDCFSGISGDMILGCLADLGVDLKLIEKEIKKSGLTGFSITAKKINKKGISSTKADVMAEETKSHRHLKDILTLAEQAKYGKKITEEITRIFTNLAKAEAKVHGTSVEKIHFHEVGAVDSIVDIFGAVIGLNMLGIDKIYSSAVSVGTGTVKCEHGVIPVPAPATVELLAGYPVLRTTITGELTTPTGAAILTSLSSGVKTLRNIRILQTGYGAGYKDLQEQANVLRITICEDEEGFHADSVIVIETNIDDMNPEHLPYVSERLLNSGALDVYYTSVSMKKGRPGYVLTVLANEQDFRKLSEIILSETSSTGLRYYPADRLKLERSNENISTEFGEVTVKKIIREGKETIVPEYEECRRIALQNNIPIQDVYNRIISLNKPV